MRMKFRATRRLPHEAVIRKLRLCAWGLLEPSIVTAQAPADVPVIALSS